MSWNGECCHLRGSIRPVEKSRANGSLFSPGFVPCIFNLLVTHTACLPAKRDGVCKRVWGSPRCAPDVCGGESWKAAAALLGHGKTVWGDLRPLQCPLIAFFYLFYVSKGFRLAPRFPRTAFLFSWWGHSRSCKVLPALLQRCQWTNDSCLPPPQGRSMGTQRVGFALSTVGLPSPLSSQLVQMYTSERQIVKSTALDGGSKGLIASFTALTFT